MQIETDKIKDVEMVKKRQRQSDRRKDENEVISVIREIVAAFVKKRITQLREGWRQ